MRVKRCFTKASEVAHRWANQTQDSAYCGNVSFEGALAYSYSTPIARLHDFNGHKVAIISTEYYSNTTAKHKNEFSRAARHHIVLWCKAGINDVRGAVLEYQDRVISDVMGTFNQLICYWDNSGQKKEEVAGFNKTALKLGFKELVLDVPQDFWDLCDDHLKRRKERNAILRAEEIKRAEEREKKRQEELKVKLASVIPEWLNGGRFDYALNQVKPQLVRIKGEIVETTGGASVSVDAAKKFLNAVISGSVKPGSKIDGYSFTGLNGDALVIGCHTLSLKQCLETLGISDPGPEKPRSIVSNVVSLFGGAR